MSRVFTAFPALRASVAQGSFPVTCVAGPSSRPFSTSPAVLAERKRFLPSRSAVKRKRNFYAQLAASERRQDDDTIYPDYVLGHVATTAPSSPFHGQSTPPSRTPWDNCRLAKTLMHPKQIWSLAPPAYDKGEKPEYLIPGLSKQDQDMLFGALPHVSTALRYDPEVPDQVREETVVKVMDQQEKQTEMLHRAMDMRNADRATINTFNLRRIQDEFGEGVDTGGAAVQAASLTMQIRGMNEHLLNARYDTKNKVMLRDKVFERVKVLRYFKRKWPRKYSQLLADIGVDPRCVEGELVFRV